MEVASPRTPRSTVKRRASSVDYFEGLTDHVYEAPLVDQSSRGSMSSDYSDHSSSGGHSVRSSPTKGVRYIRPPLSDEESSGVPLHWTSTLPADPQSPGDDNQSRKHYRRQQYGTEHSLARDDNHILPLNTSSLVFTARKRRSTFSCAVMGFCLLGFALYSNARSSLRVAVDEVNNLVDFSEKLHRQLSRADRDMRRLERELAALDAIEQRKEDEEVEERVLSQSSAFANPKLIEEMTNIQRKLKYSQTKADKLKTQVSDISKRDAMAKYGSGVIRVKMDLIFPTGVDSQGNSLPDNGPHTIVMEMASLELMPHSVYTFLEMVSSGLLNGCSFILNALHVLKAAPLPYDGTSASEKARAFLDHGLESVAFREYTPSFPHAKYTVGFAADGSPSFYINTEDNSEIHVGDPCFAKVISGFETIQRLEKMPTRNGIWFENRIGIKEATIL